MAAAPGSFQKFRCQKPWNPLKAEMAERFFKKEIQKLYLGGGQEFCGEGILAVAKTLLQSGVSCFAGYQGSRNFESVMQSLPRLKTLREAALADDTGKKLEAVLAELNLTPGDSL